MQLEKLGNMMWNCHLIKDYEEIYNDKEIIEILVNIE